MNVLGLILLAVLALAACGKKNSPPNPSSSNLFDSNPKPPEAELKPPTKLAPQPPTPQSPKPKALPPRIEPPVENKKPELPPQETKNLQPPKPSPAPEVVKPVKETERVNQAIKENFEKSVPLSSRPSLTPASAPVPLLPSKNYLVNPQVSPPAVGEVKVIIASWIHDLVSVPDRLAFLDFIKPLLKDLQPARAFNVVEAGNQFMRLDIHRKVMVNIAASHEEIDNFLKSQMLEVEFMALAAQNRLNASRIAMDYDCIVEFDEFRLLTPGARALALARLGEAMFAIAPRNLAFKKIILGERNRGITVDQAVGVNGLMEVSEMSKFLSDQPQLDEFERMRQRERDALGR